MKTDLEQDHWHAALAEALGREGPGAQPLKGRVLKVKFGYNPNSSSVGSVVNVLFWTAAAGTAAVNLVAALMAAHAQRALPAPEPEQGADS